MSVNRKAPIRTCIGCRKPANKKDLIRVLKTAENEILIDKTGKKNGRGAYICCSLECIKKAKKTRGLGQVNQKIRKKFEKPIDKAGRVCYNITRCERADCAHITEEYFRRNRKCPHLCRRKRLWCVSGM